VRSPQSGAARYPAVWMPSSGEQLAVPLYPAAWSRAENGR